MRYIDNFGGVDQHLGDRNDRTLKKICYSNSLDLLRNEIASVAKKTSISKNNISPCCRCWQHLRGSVKFGGRPPRPLPLLTLLIGGRSSSSWHCLQGASAIKGDGVVQSENGGYPNIIHEIAASWSHDQLYSINMYKLYKLWFWWCLSGKARVYWSVVFSLAHRTCNVSFIQTDMSLNRRTGCQFTRLRINWDPKSSKSLATCHEGKSLRRKERTKHGPRQTIKCTCLHTCHTSIICPISWEML